MRLRTKVPRLTVGLPVKNGERYIEGALRALLRQTWEDYVLLVADNQSDDRTAEIVQDFAAGDSRIRYVRHEPDIGVARNFSWLVQKAETELFRWQCVDDLLLPDLTTKCIEALDANPQAVMTYCRTMFIDADGVETAAYDDRMHILDDSPRVRFRRVYQNLEKVNVIYGVMRRAALLRTQLMPAYISADMGFVYELALHGKFVEVPDRLFLRRIHEHNLVRLPEAEQRRMWYPDRWRRPPFAAWHLLATLQRAIWRAPMSARDRAGLQRDLAREAWKPSFRRRLGREAVEGLRYAVSRTPAPIPHAEAGKPA